MVHLCGRSIVSKCMFVFHVNRAVVARLFVDLSSLPMSRFIPIGTVQRKADKWVCVCVYMYVYI